MVDSSSIEVKRRARHTKTDHLDVGKLVSMLIRYHNGEEKVWSVVHVPEVEEEDRRHLHRDLEDLKRERTREINRIRGLLSSQGVILEKRGVARIELDELRLWDGSALPEGMVGRVGRAQERLTFIERQIEEVEAQQTTALTQSNAVYRCKPLIGRGWCERAGETSQPLETYWASREREYPCSSSHQVGARRPSSSKSCSRFIFPLFCSPCFTK